MRVLETERLALRWLEAADAPFVLALVNDPDWLRYIGDRGIRSIEAARDYIVGGPREMYARLGFGLYLVELRGTDTALGICGLIKRDWLEDVDLGFAFLARFRGNGYACEAAAATLDYAECALGLTRIAAIVSPGNRASRRLLARVGLQFERMVESPTDSQDVCLYASARSRPVAEAHR
jgi:RimJ/RimL family protein N-acetyltransferase